MSSEPHPRRRPRPRRTASRRLLRRRPRPHRRRRQAVGSRLPVDHHGDVLGEPIRCARRSSTSCADRIHSVTLNGAPVDVAELRARRRHRAAPTWPRTTSSWSRRDMLYTNTGEGLHRFVDPVDGEIYLYSQFETADAKRMYACFDQPDLKATFTLHATVPRRTGRSISNGAGELGRRCAGREDRALRDDAAHQPVHHRARRRSVPRACATTTTASTSACTAARRWPSTSTPTSCSRSPSRASTGTTPTSVSGTRSASTTSSSSPSSTPARWRTPAASRSARTTCSVARSPTPANERRGETILHEMAHMWFGDLVTMRWWDDLWLNESFATYASTLCQAEATRWPHAWTTFANVEKTWAYRQDQLPSTHPIVDRRARRADRRGQLRRHHLRQGRERAQAARRPTSASSSSWPGCASTSPSTPTATPRSADLLGALERSSGRDLGSWSKLWLETTGINTIRPEFTLDDERALRDASTLAQSAPTDVAASNTLRPHRLAIGAVRRRRGRAAGPYRSRRAGRDRRADTGPGAGRPEPARPAAGQRRRPHVLQAAPGRAQPAHAARRRHRPAGRLAAARAVLVGRVGHDARRRACHARLRGLVAVRAPRPRPTSACCSR